VGLRIFLSYGRDEYAAAAQRIHQLLIARGHEVWFDRERLTPGADWEQLIEQGIDWVAELPDSGRVVLVMTPHAVRRPDGYCLNELAHALNRRIPVVPVMLVSVEPPLSISRLQWLDMTDCIPLPEQQSAFDRQVDALAGALEDGEVVLTLADPRKKLSDSLQPIAFDYEMSTGLADFTSRRWVIDTVDLWLNDPRGGPIFWLRGGVGAGKTTVALWLAANRAEFGAWHFCKSGHVAKSDARRCVMSLAYQFSTQLPEYRERLDSLNVKRIVGSAAGASELFDQLVLQPACATPTPDRTVVAIIDALDEATVDGRNEIVDLISSFSGRPSWLRFLVTSRPVAPMTGALHGTRQLDLGEHERETETDVLEFVRDVLARHAASSSDNAILAAAIAERAGGSFLYARAVLDDIIMGHSGVGDLARLPTGLSGTFLRLFERQFPDRTRYAERIRPFLELLAAERAPLPLTLAGAILEWGPYDQRAVLADVGSLCIVAADKIEPFHAAAVEWMTNPELAGEYWVSERAGHERLVSVRAAGALTHSSAASSYLAEHLTEHLADAGQFIEAAEELADWGRLWSRLEASQVTGRSAYHRRILRLAASWPQNLDVAPLREIVDRIRRLGWARIGGGINFEQYGVPRTIIHNDQPQSYDYGKYTLAIAVLLVGDLAPIDVRFREFVSLMLPSNVFAFLRSGASDEGREYGSRDVLLDAVKETTAKLIELGYPGAADWELPPDEWWQGKR
jgi:TIR domain-containing protein